MIPPDLPRRIQAPGKRLHALFPSPQKGGGTKRAATRRILRAVLAALLVLGCSATGLAQEGPAAGPFLKILERLPKERQGNVVKLICQRGNGFDLAIVLGKTLSPDAFAPEARLIALEGMVEAARTRKVQPRGDLGGLARLLEPAQPLPVRLLAIELAGLWKVAALRGPLEELVLAEKTPAGLRQEAIESLTRLGGKESLAALRKLTEKDRPAAFRYLGAAGVARLDPAAGAELAAAVLAGGSETVDPAPLLAPFLDLKGGTDLLADALAKTRLSADVAKLALRHLYAVGRSDPKLAGVLGQAAGISQTPIKLSAAETMALLEEVMTKGDPARGELVFRRADLSCTRCHAINTAGGGVGPDLRALGSSSPPDYVLRSILDPEEAIKEEYLTVRLFTSDARIHEGIVVDENETRVVLKDATGKQKVVSAMDIEERTRGGSLMPKGLASFLTRGELIDLVRFLSELGKPGPYAIPTTPTVRTWKVLRAVDRQLVESVPSPETLKSQVLDAPAEAWLSAYTRVSGELFLDELTQQVGSKLLYLQGEIDVTEAGQVGLALNDPRGLTLWVDGQQLEAGKKVAVELAPGRHRVTLRVDTAARDTPVRLDLFRPEGSGAAFTPVGGP